MKNFHKLSIYLIKDEVSDFKEVLKERVLVDKFELKKSLKIKGAVFVGKTKYNSLPWQDLLDEGTVNPIPKLENSSNRALLFIEMSGRIFAIPFGYGKHLLKEDLIEREFGLRTVLNLVNADKLRSLDKANLDDLTVLTRTQTSRKARPEAFNLDIIRDLLRGVTGEPEKDNLGLGNIITGNEGIYILPLIDFPGILECLKVLKKGYESKKYKARFGWIDNIKAERDPGIIDSVTNHFIADLKLKDELKIQLVPHSILDWENFSGFSFTPKGETKTDFEIQDFYEYQGEKLGEMDWDKFQRLKLHINAVDEESSFSIPLWRCINYQTEFDGHLFVFAFGKWYRISKNYVKEIKDYVKDIEESSLNFIDCSKGLDEGAYNTELVNSNPDLVLFDKKLVKSSLTRSGIEVCDVLSKKGEFVHVKIRKSSSTLSHLFAQGRVSGTLLVKDNVFRRNLRAKLKENGLPKRMVPLQNKEIKTSKYTITFAIIEEKKRNFIDALPFFSLLNFRLTAEDLILLGYKVRVKKIQIK
jgi:uncharacterized protein (TIGR04141 family)